MKLFTQLALVTAIATCGSAAYAMQSMDDAALSDTTGQDGITILIAPPTLTIAQQNVAGQPVLTQTNGLIIGAAVLHDKDGFIGNGNTASNNSGGAIIMGDASQAYSGSGPNTNAVGTQMGIFGSTPIKLFIDASGGLSGAAPVLNVNVVLPADFLIRTGDISIDGSNRSGLSNAQNGLAANAATGGTKGHAVKILNSMDIAMGGANMNIQLGNTPQGAMINMNGTVIGGIHISGFALHDGNAALGVYNGDLGIGMISIRDQSGANLTMNATVDVVNNAGSALYSQMYATAGGQAQGAAAITAGVTASLAATYTTAYTTAYNAFLVTNPGQTANADAAGITAGNSAKTAAYTATVASVTTAVQSQGAANIGSATSQGGLLITSNGPASNILMQNITLGNSTSTLGDFELINVQMAGTKIAIMGH